MLLGFLKGCFMVSAHLQISTSRNYSVFQACAPMCAGASLDSARMPAKRVLSLTAAARSRLRGTAIPLRCAAPRIKNSSVAT